MNKKGLFCFLIALGFVGIIAAIAASSTGESIIFNETKGIAFEIEKLDLERAVLEENIDFLIRETMESELEKGNRNPEQIKEKASEKLVSFFMQAEKEAANRGIAIVFFQKNGPVSEEFLNLNSKVLVVNYENIALAEYNFTGGIFKDAFLKAKIESKNSEKTFELPIGYSQKAFAAGLQ
ncbi:MAG: hypothetical protein PHD95_02140 [Candidatus ainarchaeum sp.]|nr:hypothetical protein [Candidatus ainarchaeum sp.]